MRVRNWTVEKFIRYFIAFLVVSFVLVRRVPFDCQKIIERY